MILSHKIELNPTKEQITQFEKACGCARFAYNWALNKWNEQYKVWKGNNTLPKPNANLIKKEFNSIKEKEFPWIYESPKDANQRSFFNLNKAFQKFFKKTAKYPTFKKKFKKDSFYISNDKFSINEFEVQLPLIGKVDLKEKFRFKGKIQSATISRNSNKWFISLNVEIENYSKEKSIKNEIIGIDLGLKNFATCSDNTSYQAPKPLKHYSKKLKRAQIKLSKKQKGSNNRNKQRLKVAKIHYKIKCIRNDFLHKLSTKICSENQTIVLENLKVSNMLKNHKLAKSISDASWSEFKRQIEYKSQIYQNKIVIVGTFEPTSKVCSNCGCKKQDLKLHDRIFKCDDCGFQIDRDLNASLNLYTLGLREIDACGQNINTNESYSKANNLIETRNNIRKEFNNSLYNYKADA